MISIQTQSIRQPLLNFSIVVMGLFVFSIYISTAMAIILSGVLGVLWLATARFNELKTIFNQSAMPRWALALFCCFIAGLAYGDAPGDEAISMLKKYRELLFIPLLSCFFTDVRYRTLAWKAFFAASVFTLLSSFLMSYGMMKSLTWTGSFSLKSRITHSVFMAFFTFYCGHKVLNSIGYRLLYAVLFVLGVVNLFFIVQGRTGQLAVILLVGLLGIQRLNKSGLLLMVAVLSVFLLLFMNFSDKSSRVHQGIKASVTYLQNREANNRNDMGIRFKYWESASKLIAEKPFLGHGTGGFGAGYQRVSGDKAAIQNSHNEFLMIAVQFGTVGLVVYLGFLGSIYSGSHNMPESDKWLTQGVLVTLIVSSLFNSPFLDHAEGHWFSTMIALCFGAIVKPNNNQKNSEIKA